MPSKYVYLNFIAQSKNALLQLFCRLYDRGTEYLENLLSSLFKTTHEKFIFSDDTY